MRKARSQQKHTARRARERFGIKLTRNDQIDMVGMIRDGQSQMLERQSLRISVHEVEWDGHKLRVVYDKSRRTIVTVLPESWMEEYER